MTIDPWSWAGDFRREGACRLPALPALARLGERDREVARTLDFSAAIRPPRLLHPSFSSSPLCLSRRRRPLLLVARSFVRPSSCSHHRSLSDSAAAATRWRTAASSSSLSVSVFQTFSLRWLSAASTAVALAATLLFTA